MSRRPVLALLVVALVALAGCSGTVLDPGGGSTTAGTTTSVGTTVAPVEDGTTDTPSGTDTGSALPNGTLSVRFIDVGQGASALVVGPTGETMLIDTGPWQDDGEAVLTSLDRANVSRVDYLVTSHADADHIGGHAAVIEALAERGDGVGAVYDPGVAASSKTYERYLDAVEQYDVPLYRTAAGDPIPFEGATVTVLAPPAGLLDGDRNENSVVLRVAFGTTAFLFTGDAGDVGEAFLVERYGSDLGATVLHAGHHGSSTSSSVALLDAVRPRLVVVSSAYDSPYGHPHEEVLERFDARDLPTLWTGVHGSIVVESDGETATALAQRAVPTGPTGLRSAGPFEPGDETDELTALASVTGTETEVVPVGDGGDDDSAATVTTTDDGATGGDSGSLRLETVHADAAGADSENLTDEYLVFTNAGDESIDLSGWSVEDEAGHSYTFPDGTVVEPEATLTLRTGSGADATGERFWGSSSPVWNNAGDTVIVRTDEGVLVLEERYDGG